MQQRTFRTIALILMVAGLAPAAPARDASSEGPSLSAEFTASYPRAPKTLDGDPMQSSLLLLEFEMKGILRMNGLDGAVLVKTGDGGDVIRARTLKGRLVMFNLDEAGSYSLRFVRVSNGNSVIVLEPPPALDMHVDLARGRLSYFGTVVMSKKFGPDAPAMELVYDAEKEAAAWSTFKEKYPTSPWSALAEKRIAALKSGETAVDVQPASSASRDPLIHDACMRVYAEEFRQKAGDEKKAQAMAEPLCQVISSDCQKDLRGEPCLKSIRHLNESFAKSGESLPYMAAYAGRTDLIKTLIEVGADISKPAQSAGDSSAGGGWTPVMIAAAEGHSETVSALVNAGADVNATNSLGRTALMFASSGGSLAIVKDLLAHRADPNIVPKDQTGWTALIAAAHKGHVDVIRALLEDGADPSIGDAGGQTALAWAEAEGREDVATVLRDSIGKK